MQGFFFLDEEYFFQWGQISGFEDGMSWTVLRIDKKTFY